MRTDAADLKASARECSESRLRTGSRRLGFVSAHPASARSAVPSAPLHWAWRLRDSWYLTYAYQKLAHSPMKRPTRLVVLYSLLAKRNRPPVSVTSLDICPVMDVVTPELSVVQRKVA